MKTIKTHRTWKTSTDQYITALWLKRCRKHRLNILRENLDFVRNVRQYFEDSNNLYISSGSYLVWLEPENLMA